MSANVIACVSIAGAGILLVLISIPFLLREKALKKKCSAQTIGHVIKYKRCGGDNNRYYTPMAEFKANGKTYKAFRHFKSFSKVKVTNSLSDQSFAELVVTPKERLHMQMKEGQGGVIHSLVAEKWPIGSEVPIVYNPTKPKQSFVEKVVTVSNVAGIVLLSCGGGLMVLAGIAYFVF